MRSKLRSEETSVQDKEVARGRDPGPGPGLLQ